MYPARKTAAFSLAEVALALGVVAFALTSLLSLISVALSSGLSAKQDTTLAATANDAMGELKRRHFCDIPAGYSYTDESTTPNVLPGTANVTPDASGTITFAAQTLTSYYDETGTHLLMPKAGPNGTTVYVDYVNANVAVAAGALYQCVCTMQGDASTLGAIDTSNTRVVNQMNVTLSFYWPVLPATNNAPSTSSPNVRTIQTTIARH